MPNKFADNMKKTRTANAAKTSPRKSTKSTVTPASPHYRPSRDDCKHVGGYYDPEVSKQMRLLSVNEDRSVQDLLAEAMDMLFHDRKLPTIAQKEQSA